MLPCPTSVCGVLVFTWVRLQQPQEQCYPTATGAVLPCPTSVFGDLMFTWVWLQQPQELCYPVLPVYVVF